jgi:hypothetical protein
LERWNNVNFLFQPITPLFQYSNTPYL